MKNAKGAACFALLLLCGGCMNLSEQAKIQLVGLSFSNFQRCAGVPTTVVDLEDGGKLAEYRHTMGTAAQTTPVSSAVVADAVETVAAVVALPLVIPTVVANAGTASFTSSSTEQCNMDVSLVHGAAGWLVDGIKFNNTRGSFFGGHYHDCVPMLYDCLRQD